MSGALHREEPDMIASHGCVASIRLASKRHFVRLANLLALIVLCATAAGAEPILWDPDSGGNAHFYEWVPAPDEITWDQAASAAEARPWQGMVGHLAVVTTPEENAWLWDRLGHPVECWLGGRQTPGTPANGDEWMWITGDMWTFANWEPGQPDGPGDGRIQFDPATTTGGWADACAACAGKGYIVEYAPASTRDERLTWGILKALF
jgi:hypothetical protein